MARLLKRRIDPASVILEQNAILNVVRKGRAMPRGSDGLTQAALRNLLKRGLVVQTRRGVKPGPAFPWRGIGASRGKMTRRM